MPANDDNTLLKRFTLVLKKPTLVSITKKAPTNTHSEFAEGFCEIREEASLFLWRITIELIIYSFLKIYVPCKGILIYLDFNGL